MNCTCCGKDIGEFTLDIGYKLPDIVFSIPKNNRKNKATFTSDLCQYNNKNYIRGIAFIPINEADTYFAWGIWVEVNEKTFNKYIEIYDKDGSNEPAEECFIANTPVSYQSTENLKAKIHFGPPRERPNIIFETSSHLLSKEQNQGITVERVHEINQTIS